MKALFPKNFVLVIVAILLTLAACVPGANRRRTESVRQHWNNTVHIENETEALFGHIVQSTNEGYQEISIKYPLARQCFENSGEVLREAVAGRYDTSLFDDDPDAEPSFEVSGVAIGQALVVNEAYPGDIAECQRLMTQIAEDISVWRQSRANNFRDLWDHKQDLDTQYQGDLYRSLAVDLMQYAQEQAIKAGVPVPSYVYPTFHLEVVTRDHDICDYYRTDWNPALNQCVLNAKAAYEFMFRPFVAAEVQESFDSGVDDLNPLDQGE